MATYTVEIRKLVENHFDLGLKDYPIFDEAYREGLNDKIIKHFYFREIGFETAGLFKFYLNQKMAEIMPYYNQLYKSELLKFNPFYNVDRTTQNDGVRNGTSSRVGNTKTVNENEMNTTSTENNVGISSNNSSDLSKGKKVHSDTPQGLLQINEIEDEVYATTADYNTDVNNSMSTATNTNNGETKQSGTNTTNISADNIDNSVSNNTESYLMHVLGKEGSETYSEMLKKYRDTFLNIDMMIIEDLNELFMNVY